MTHETPDNVLVEMAKAGNGDSFTELCRRYYPAMVAIAHAIVGDRHFAEDAAQQAFAKAALHLHRLRKAGQFGSWLAAICRNSAHDVVRANRRLPDRQEPAAAVIEPQQDDAGPAVRAALDRLEPQAREVIYLRFYDGLSYERIGEVLGISQQAISGRLRRAKRELAKHLRCEGFDEVRL